MNAIHWLVVTAAMTASFWVVYVLDRFARLGILKSLQNPQEDDRSHQSLWAQRAMRAHANAIENLVLFGVLVLGAAATGLADHPTVVLAAQLYFVARLAHFVVYTAGVPILRTLSFLMGFGAQAVLVWTTLGAV